MSKRGQEARVFLFSVILVAVFPADLICGDHRGTLDLTVEANKPNQNSHVEIKNATPVTSGDIYQRFAERETQRQEEVMGRAYLDLGRKWLKGYRHQWHPRYLYPNYFAPRHMLGAPLHRISPLIQTSAVSMVIAVSAL